MKQSGQLGRWRGMAIHARWWWAMMLMTSCVAAFCQTNLPVLTNIAQIRALTPAEANRGYPVRLTATVTFHNHYRLCFAQDSTGAIYVKRKPDAELLQRGESVEFEGVTAAGDYAPILVEEKMRRLGRDAMPAAHVASFDELATGESDCQWVEVRGIVRFVKLIPGSHLHLELAVGGGRLRAYVFDYPQTNYQRLVDATVTLRGAVGSIYNQNNQFVAPLLFAGGTTNLVIEEPSPPEPFSAPTRSVTSLLQYTPGTSHGHRVKVSGVVTYQDAGRALFIRDRAQGLRVETKETTAVKPGEIIEVLGFPVMGQYTPALEDAIFRRIGDGEPPAPVTTTIGEILSGSHDADLVSVEARLLDVVRRGNESILVLQTDDLIFNAHFARPTGLDHLQKGSRLQVTGICLIQEAREFISLLTPRAFGILLRSPSDVVVLQKPSWWTMSRVLWVLVATIIALLAGVAWVVVLNRRVRQQTSIIQQKAQHEAVLEERSRIAREFHDTLEQELAAITIQLNTVASQFGESPEAARQQLELARNMSRRSLVEARRSVWDLRSHLLENSDLVTALSAMAKPLVAGSSARIKVETTGAPRKLSASIENNLLRIAQEALANAVKHAHAKNIRVELQYEPGKVRLRIRDDGCGFQVNDHLSLSGGHFGLLDMRERAEKCGGVFSLRSDPNIGTQIIVELRDKAGGNGDGAPESEPTA